MSPEILSNKAQLIKFAILLALSILLVSCETVSYYTQAARGQLAIVFGREDIQRLIDSGDLSSDLDSKFSEVMSIREFAAAEMSLPVEQNYSSYVDVEREHVVWNVFAAPEFSTDPVNWCYPIAGCVSYRGYFSEAGAENYAAGLEQEGFDVYTGGVDAYSTLGWFDDSLLSTVMSRATYQLAGLIFHELAHQVAYLPGDTTFNESFATAVEREGLRRWLDTTEQSETIAIAELNRDRQEQFVNLVSLYRYRFDSLYQEEIGEEQKRQEKSALQYQLRAEYELLKGSWNGYDGYDAWFSRSLNNAQLSTVSSYNDLVPFFNDLLLQSGGEMNEFFDAVNTIIAMTVEDREALLGVY
jgi:predicted aminopeptidase